MRGSFHPNVLVELFEIDLRTVWRWSKKWRLTKKVVAKALYDWRNSCSFGEACTRLRVTQGTVQVWRRKGLLKKVMVFTQSRITLSSIHDVLNHPKYRPGQKKVLFNALPERKIGSCQKPKQVTLDEVYGLIELKVAKTEADHITRLKQGRVKAAMTRARKSKTRHKLAS